MSNIAYGTEKLGRLRQVLLHTPNQSLNLVNQSNFEDYLFNFPPDIEQYRQEHNQYADLLRSGGVQVQQLQDFALFYPPAFLKTNSAAEESKSFPSILMLY